MKRALVDAGVDVSDCFERADLEAKYVLFSEAQNNGTATREEQPEAKQEERSRSAEASSAASDAASAASSKAIFSNVQRFLKDTLDGIKSKFSIDAVRDAIREKANRVNAKYGTGNKAQEYLDNVRRKVSETDSKLGVTKWFKTNVPKAM